jgi:hypothetical protein
MQYGHCCSAIEKLQILFLVNFFRIQFSFIIIFKYRSQKDMLTKRHALAIQGLRLEQVYLYCP